jgi:Leucine-rich repeat (LRR) protein
MDSLTDLDISGNFGMSGGIPASIGKLKNLTLLSVKNCGLSGLIPDEFSNLTKLKMFDASNNDFSGDLPSTEKMENIRKFWNFFIDIVLKRSLTTIFLSSKLFYRK